MIILSIIVPTIRSELCALGQILRYWDLESKNVEVIIVDASNDINRHKILRNFKRENNILITESAGSAEADTMLGANVARGKYLSILHDDDYILKEYFPQISQRLHDICSVEEKSVVALVPNITLLQRTKIEAPKFLDISTPILNKRIQNFVDSPTKNLFAFSFLSKKSFHDCYEFLESLPVKLPHFDWLFSLTFLMQGEIEFIDLPWLIYNNHHWEDDDVGRSFIENAYKKLALHSEAHLIHPLVSGVEGAALIHYYSNTKKPQNSDAVFVPWLKRRMNMFLAPDFKTLQESYHVKKNKAFQDNLTSGAGMTLNDLVIFCGEYIFTADEQKRKEYQNFWIKLLNY